MTSKSSPQKITKYDPLPWIKPGIPVMLGIASSLMLPAGTVSSALLKFVQSLYGPFAPITAISQQSGKLFLNLLASNEYTQAIPKFMYSVADSESPVSRALDLPLTDVHSAVGGFLFYFLLIFFLVAYVKIMFPKIDKKTKTPNLDLVSSIHNPFLVWLSTFMMTESLYQAFLHRYSFVGNESPKMNELGMAKIVWVFYFSKTIEWIDTVLIILKQNWRQLSFLHIYHHASIYIIWWFIAQSSPGGDAYYCVFLNSLVHVIMYTYYMFRSLKLNIWWKKYITMFQMFQFLTMMAHARYDIVHNVSPVWLYKLQQWYMPSLFLLFLNFYIMNMFSGGKKNSNKAD